MGNNEFLQQPVKSIGFQMYDVTLNLHCDNSGLVDYLESLMPGLSKPAFASPDLVVNARWTDEPHERGVSMFPDSKHLNGIGKRMQMAKDELVWFDTHRDKDMQLRFRREDGKIIFDVAYCFQPSQKKLAKYPDFKHKKYFDLARYLVFFPIAWHLERTRGWALIHASAVAENDRAVMIAGPGGAGKTTTCVALIVRTNMKLLTENLLFCDGERIFPVIEPLRLTDDSLALLGDNLHGLETIKMPNGLRTKTMYWSPEGQSLSAATPAILFIPQFSQRGFVKPIAPEIAGELLHAMNRLTLELNDYYWYTAGLDMLWPAPGNAQKQLEVLQKLVANTPCYSLGIDKTAGVTPVVNQILYYMDSPTTVLEVKQ